jgi:hypothetical protein
VGSGEEAYQGQVSNRAEWADVRGAFDLSQFNENQEDDEGQAGEPGQQRVGGE